MWEYKITSFYIGGLVNKTNTEHELNEFGKEGWELVSAWPSDGFWITYTFKRHIPDDYPRYAVWNTTTNITGTKEELEEQGYKSVPIDMDAFEEGNLQNLHEQGVGE